MKLNLKMVLFSYIMWMSLKEAFDFGQGMKPQII